MAIVEDEMASAMILLVEAHRNLKETFPNHKLLEFVEEIYPTYIKFTKEFFKRFSPVNQDSGHRQRIDGVISYTKALREAKIA